MKRNLILSIIACGASLALSPGLHAQDAAPAPVTTGTDSGAGEHRHGGGGGDQLARLTTELSLTADQQAQIKPIPDTLHTTIQTTRADNSLARPDQMAKIKEAHETANTAINALLTPDQQTKFAAMKEKMHNRHGGGAESQVSASPVATP